MSVVQSHPSELMFKHVKSQEHHPKYGEGNKLCGFEMGREYHSWIIFGREIRLYKNV